MPKLSAEEIAWRKDNPERMQRILAGQREIMARDGICFQDGAVVQDNERIPTELHLQENTEIRTNERKTEEICL